MTTILIKNARIVSPGFDLPTGSLLIEGSKISGVFPAGSSLPHCDHQTDAAGLMLVPGFIDIHTHGANGHDTNSGQAGEITGMAEAKVREGVTTFLPTTLTLPPEKLEQIARAVAAYIAAPTFAKVPGLHVEGPFINPKFIGAQNPEFVRPPDPTEIDRLHAVAPVRIVSLAVEMPGGIDFVAAMRERGIRTSLAHTAATFADFQVARAVGLGHLTHFCNQMTSLHHREIGCVGAGLLDPDIMIELICDKIHLCPDMLRLVWTLKPASRLMIITDSMSASWLPDGTYELGGLDVHVQDRQARLANGALAGSTALYYEEFHNILETTGLPASEVVAATSWNQARSLGLPGLGKIEPGFTADLALLDPANNHRPRIVWVDGEQKLG